VERYLVGPTAIGKSAVAERLAERAPITAISLDSMQVFRRMDVGTAKPTAAERARLPHELIDVVEPWESFSVAEYLDRAREAHARLGAEGRIALYVGGTALYLKALLHGMFAGPSTDPEIRARLKRRAVEEGAAALHRELARADPVAAERIHPNDQKRVIRALEVFELTGEPISELQREWARPPGKVVRVAGLRMRRELLHRRIARRVEAMLAAGWIEEVRAILDAGGFGPQASKAVGYAEILRYLRGELERERLALEITAATRRFARRQMTWFRSFPQIMWIDVAEDAQLDAIARGVERRLMP
jgi:tRNA dimethylallyltransferase